MSMQCCLQKNILRKAILFKGKVKTLSEDTGHIQSKALVSVPANPCSRQLRE